tara:strand:+ start:7695 stop:8627 length:933 start_codon:yes stop_codon:yes gene_type:complete
MNSLRAYVTGGTGFIGYHLIDSLVKYGWLVTALHRPESATSHLKKLGVNLVQGDLTKKDTILDTIPNGIDSIFHVAGNVSFSSIDNSIQNEDNILGTRNLLNAAIEKKCKRFIFTSTAATSGLHLNSVNEETKSNAMEIPINYFHSKKLAEELVLKSSNSKDIDAVILNPANVVGPFDRKIWTPLTINISKKKLEYIGSGTGSFCHVKNVAKAHVSAFHKGRNGNRYLLSGATAKFYEVTKLIAKLTNSPIPKLTEKTIMGISPELSLLMSSHQFIDCSKAILELDYTTCGIEDMFGDLVKWMKHEGLLD